MPPRVRSWLISPDQNRAGRREVHASIEARAGITRADGHSCPLPLRRLGQLRCRRMAQRALARASLARAHHLDPLQQLLRGAVLLGQQRIGGMNLAGSSLAGRPAGSSARDPRSASAGLPVGGHSSAAWQSRQAPGPPAFLANMPIASWPLVAGTTRYPFVDNMKLMTESSCSLSSTQSITFFGRMMWGYHSFFKTFKAFAPATCRHARSNGGFACCIVGPIYCDGASLSIRIVVTSVVSRCCVQPWRAPQSRKKTTGKRSTPSQLSFAVKNQEL